MNTCKIIIKKTIMYSLLILILFLWNCAGTIHTNRLPGYDFKNFKKAYIVSAKNSQYIKFQFGILAGMTYIPPVNEQAESTEKIGNTDIVLKNELEKYGIVSVIGTEGTVPEDVDIIVKYSDVWRWDFKKILEQLEINLINAKSNKVIGEATYNIGSKEFHNFPTPEKEVPKMIKKLMEGK